MSKNSTASIGQMKEFIEAPFVAVVVKCCLITVTKVCTTTQLFRILQFKMQIQLELFTVVALFYRIIHFSLLCIYQANKGQIRLSRNNYSCQI